MGSRGLLLTAAALLALGLGVGLYAYLDRQNQAGIGIPQPATQRPEFTLTDLTGRRRHIGEWDGSALVVNFWATWCPPCRREIPMLIDLQEEFGDSQVQIIGVAVDFLDDVRAYSDEMPFNYPILVGEQDAIDAAEGFGIDFLGLPFTAFTDRSGRILHVHIGELHRPQVDAILQLIATLDTSLELDLARQRVRDAAKQP